MTIVGNSYPAIESPQLEDIFSQQESSLYGKYCKQGYQSHYALGIYLIIFYNFIQFFNEMKLSNSGSTVLSSFSR